MSLVIPQPLYYQILIKIMHTAQTNKSCMKIHATLHNYVNRGQFLQRRFQFCVKQTWVSWQIEYKNYRGMKKEKVSQPGGGFRNLLITFIQKTFTDFFPSTKIVTGDHSTDSTDIAKKWIGLATNDHMVHGGGQAQYYSRTGTLKQRDLNQWSLTYLFFDVPVRE